jgi:hypothetical protein
MKDINVSSCGHRNSADLVVLLSKNTKSSDYLVYSKLSSVESSRLLLVVLKKLWIFVGESLLATFYFKLQTHPIFEPDNLRNCFVPNLERLGFIGYVWFKRDAGPGSLCSLRERIPQRSVERQVDWPLIAAFLRRLDNLCRWVTAPKFGSLIVW